MQFGRSPAATNGPIETDTPSPHAEQGPVVRHARKDGQLVATIRAAAHGSTYLVEAEVHPRGTMQLVRPGPYTFQNAHEAMAFMTEAVTALIYLGCDVQAQEQTQ